MDWLQNLLFDENSIAHIVLLYSFVIAVGVLLGKIKFFGVSLGVTFVLFTGIVCGHFGLTGNTQILTFLQDFGLILFVFCIGLQVGPSFFSSFKKGGIAMNLVAMGIVALNIAVAVALYYGLNGRIELPMMVGILCGAVTNTPGLGAANEALSQLNYSGPQIAMGYACAYPLGVLGIIGSITAIRYICRINLKKEEEDIAKEEAANPHLTPRMMHLEVHNEALAGKTLLQVRDFMGRDFVCSRILQNGHVSIPTSDKVLKEGDRLLVITAEKNVMALTVLFGEQENTDWNKEDIDWNAIDSQLISRRIVVTRNRVNGVKLGSLRLRNLYGINITRVNRAGIDLVASRDLRLQIGDKLTIVGEANSVNNVGKILGDELKRLDNPNLLAIFVGLTLGVLIGAIPIAIPGMSTPIKLGIAGGPIIVGILMGAFGPRFHLTTYTTQSANLMMRQFGIVIYLAGLGIDSGAHFFETVFRAEGLLWIGLGFLLTIVPVLIVGFIASQFFKLDYAHNIGMLCGSMANPMALSYANTTVEGDEPSVSYATVYPLSMFIRVISAQLLIMLFT